MAALQFMAPWWNRHLGLSLDGYMPWFGHRILSGEIPYRDFFLHLPPLHALAEALLEAVVGKSILAGRVAGVAVHLLLAVVLALWLGRTFRPWLAIFASLGALAVATSDGTEILDLYNPHAALGALASGYFACLAMSTSGSRSRAWGWASGVAASISFWTKQTVGLGAAVAVPVAIALLCVKDPDFRRTARRLASRFIAGWILIAIPVVLWLSIHGAFGFFLQQVFLDASGSKGSPFLLLLRPWSAPLDMPAELRVPGIVALLLACAALFFSPIPPTERQTPARGFLSAAAGWGAATAMLVAGAKMADRLVSLSGGVRRTQMELIAQARWLVILFAMYAVTLLCARVVWKGSRGRIGAEQRELAVFTLVAGALAVMQALSMGVTGALAMPSLALVICVVVGSLPRRRQSILIAAPFLLVNAVAIAAPVTLLHLEPFRFAGWVEPGRHASRMPSSLAELSGLELSSRTVRTVDGIVDALKKATDPGEPIFTYSVYPIFYWLADRPSATFASLHWADVTPDHVVDRDMETLKENPPVAVVWQYLNEFQLSDNEAYYRGGNESGVRRMNRALAHLLESRYRKVVALPSREDGRRGPPIEVWVRSDRADARGLAPAP